MSFFSLENKVAIITGGSSGIGKSAAERFVKAGANVVIAARSDASEFAESIGATFVKTDVAIESDVENLVALTVAKFGRVDVLIANAGYIGSTDRLTEQTAGDFERSFAVNTYGTLYCIKHAVPHMPKGSSIICTTSLSALIGASGYSAYSASKWATSGLIRCATMELGPKGIRVNEICPTSVDTPMLRAQDNFEMEVAVSSAMAAIDHLVQPEEIAALMHFLACDDCPALTGQRIAVDGGASVGWSDSVVGAVLGAQAPR